MTVSTAALYGLLAALTIAGIIALFVVIPRALRSMYRLELWGLRDRLVDDLIMGRIRTSKPAIATLNLIEHGIAASHEFTALRVVLVVFAARNAPPNPEYLHGGVPDVERLRAYKDELTKIRLRWFVMGSVSGWLAPIWVGPAYVLYRLLTGKPARAEIPPREQIVSRRVDSSLQTALDLDRIDTRQLLHCA